MQQAESRCVTNGNRRLFRVPYKTSQRRAGDPSDTGERFAIIPGDSYAQARQRLFARNDSVGEPLPSEDQNTDVDPASMEPAPHPDGDLTEPMD